MSEDTHLPQSSRFSFPPSTGNSFSLDSRPPWSTPGGSTDKIRFIHSDSISEGTYRAHRWPQRKINEASSTTIYTTAKNYELEISENTGDVSEIPVFNYGKDFTSDPILFVERVREAGKKFGAVKVKMPTDFVNRFLTDHLVDPEALIFRAKRLLRNPSENELLTRLKFFNDLITFHTSQSVPPEQDKSDSDMTIPQSDGNHSVSDASLDLLLQTIKVEEGSSVVPEKSVTSDSDPLALETEETQVKAEVSTKIVEPQTEVSEVQEVIEKSPSPLVLLDFPALDNRPLDLYEFYRFVMSRGGYDEVVNKNLWVEIGHELGYSESKDHYLSSFLEESYLSILRAVEGKLYDRKGETGSSANETNDSLFRKRKKLNNGAPLILGSAKDFHRSVRLKASKGFLLNEPHLVSIKPPLILGVRNEPSSESNEKSHRSARKTEEKHTPITSAAQINHFVKWLACGLANIQDASRYNLASKYESYYSLKQYMMKDLKFQQYLMKSYPSVFGNNANELGGSSGETSKKIAIQEFERLYWMFIENTGELESLDGMKLESGYSVPSSVSSGFYQLGDDFYENKLKEFNKNTHGVSALDLSGPATTSSQPTEASSSVESIVDSSSVSTTTTAAPTGFITPSSNSVSISDGPITAGPSTTPSTIGTGEISQSPTSFVQESSHVDIATANGNISSESSMGSTNSGDQNRAHRLLSPFNIHNIPVLPNSLLGAYSALDVNNRDLTNSRLNVSMTFGTENWSCEDHFTQLCNYHSFGAGKRWYFIPELDFSKFESLVQELVSLQNGDADISRVNVNYRKENWHFDELEMAINKDVQNGSVQLECLKDSMENMVNPYPEIRVNHKSSAFQNLIDKKKNHSKGVFLNQELLITPQLLREKGINFTTTVQQQGEFIFKYPKTYSSSFSLGLNINEEINFASKLWLDYAEEGEMWLAKQGILPNMLIFRMLINFAQFHESNDFNGGRFDAEIYSEVLSIYSIFLDRELSLRAKIRETLKIKETTVEERNVSDADCIADDTLQNAFPSKIVISEAHTHHQIVMTLPGFLEYAATVASEDNLELNMITDKSYNIELQLLYSDEKLRNFQRILSSYSVDFEGWLNYYESLMKSGEEVSMKVYKSLLSEGWKIYSAVSNTNYTFKTFSEGSNSQSSELAVKIKNFKEEVENLQRFVDESMEIVEQCQSILSLKHQQRIRNHGGESTPQVINQQLGGSLDLLLELVNKIPNLNFYTPEFDQIFEFKSEIENFDRACRALIQKPNASLSELNDMISLGMSFGVQIPSLGFMTRLRDRQKWLLIYETIISGGDPFIEKKDIFFLRDLLEFRDEGLRVLAGRDIEKIKEIDAYATNGNSYDSTVTSYLLANSVLNNVDLKDLDAIIDDMVERSKKIGSDRLFVTSETYSRILDLKAQSGHIKFLSEYLTKSHNLFDITQKLTELQSCGFRFDDSFIQKDLAQTHQWLDNANSLIKQANIVFTSRSRPKIPILVTRHATEPALVVSSLYTYNNCATAFAGEDVDSFTRGSSWVFLNNLDFQFDEKHPVRYCMCRDFEDGVMIECDRCHEWYHVNCVNASNDIDDENEKYSCPVCLLLDAYKSTGVLPEIEGKISQDSVTKLIAKGDELRIVPQPEVQALRDIASLVQRAHEYFEKQRKADVNVGYGPLYTLFVARKFYGSPVCDVEEISKLFEMLKEVDIPGIFKEVLASRAEKSSASVQEAQVGSPDTVPVPNSTQVVNPVSPIIIPTGPPKIVMPDSSAVQSPLNSLVVPILVSQKIPETGVGARAILASPYSSSGPAAIVPVHTKNEESVKNEVVQIPPMELKREDKNDVESNVVLVPLTSNVPSVNLPTGEQPKADEPKVDEPEVDEPKVDEPKVDESKVELIVSESKIDVPKADKVEGPKSEPEMKPLKSVEPMVKGPKVSEPKDKITEGEGNHIITSQLLSGKQQSVQPVTKLSSQPSAKNAPTSTIPIHEVKMPEKDA